MKRKQSIEQVRWDLALRYRLIETVVWWEGRLTTGHLIQSFGISRQQASKDINTYITEHAPRNLTYDKQRKGYVPSKHFKPLFIDDSASAYLHLLYQNNERAPHIEGLALAYAHTKVLEVPDRSIRPQILRPLLKACREGLRLETEYVSLANPEPEVRLIQEQVHRIRLIVAKLLQFARPQDYVGYLEPVAPAQLPFSRSRGMPRSISFSVAMNSPANSSRRRPS